MAFTVARTRDEAHLYLDLHPCACGSADTSWEHALVAVDGEPAAEYAGVCGGCGAERAYRFGLPAKEVTSASYPNFGGPEASTLLDAGEWLHVADLTAGRVPYDPAKARRVLNVAAAAMAEVIKFIPPGQETVSDDAFWTERGRQMRQAEPGRFQLDRLLVVRDTYRDLAKAQ